jgi:hypothetical protein
MTEPLDFYADLASMNVAPNGMTLVLLRSMPLPAGSEPDGSLVLDEAHPNTDRTGPVSLSFELVARVRISPQFAVQLRDLLSRTIDQLTTLSADITVHEASSEVSSAE